VKELRAAGVDAIHGDASSPEVLAAARIDRARSLIVSAAGLSGIEEAVRIARQRNPSVQILARATMLREVPALRAAGADVVMSGEGEVALAFTAAILRRLGATPDQIDRERTRVRRELESPGG
jgi:CPA2 family monovalent cation:H+ antiporter-2